MHFDKFSFGTLRIDGSTYEQDVVIDRGEIRKRKKTLSSARRHLPGNSGWARYLRSVALSGRGQVARCTITGIPGSARMTC
jgi:hypothetical protein